MAFAARNLSVLAYANGFTLWHYKAVGEDQKTLAAPGFFNGAADMLTAGDIVMVSAPYGGRLLTVLSQTNPVRIAPLS
jgi:hypothetical protein